MAWTVDNTVIWFIKSSSSEDEAQGSAVAVRLQKKDGRPKTYLLTCGHVVRGSSRDGVAGAGAVLSQLRGWRSGVGFTGRQGQSLRIIESGASADADEELPEEERTATFDWILLEFEAEKPAVASPAVSSWAGRRPAGPYSVWGFPGEQPFDEDRVEPTRTHDSLNPHEIGDDEIRSVSTMTRAGMSGGGLFDSDGRFVGIHRSRRDDRMMVVAVSADYIRRQLEERGYRVVVQELPDISPSVSELGRIIRAEGADWRETLDRWLPRASVLTRPQNAGDHEALLAGLRELEKVAADERGLCPLHGFALERNRRHPSAALRAWIEKNVPDAFQKRIEQPVAVARKGEMRIVVELTTVGPPADDPELQEVEYTIWFVGFPRSLPTRTQRGLLGVFGTVLERAWDDVRGNDLSRVWVELFLAKRLLDWRVEALKVRVGKFALRIGKTHPFALRLNREEPLRLEAEKFNRSLSLHRFDSFAAIPKLCDSHVLVEAPGDADPTALYESLEGKERVLGVLWTSRPRTASNDDGDVWDAVCQAGVPLVAWLRDIPDPRPDLGGEFHQKTWDELAGVVTGLRNQGAAWPQHLAVVLDDDRREHPNRIRYSSQNTP